MIEKISYAEVTDIAKQFSDSSFKMKDILQTVERKMQEVNTEATWKSDAAENLYQRFKALSSKFELFYSAVKGYSDFLLQAVETYKAADAAIKSASDNLDDASAV